MADWLNNDTLFEHELRTGHQYANLVADQLRQYGTHVDVTPYSMRNTVNDRHQYHDEYDLMAAGRRIEVKSRRITFTEPADYPYPTALVYSARG